MELVMLDQYLRHPDINPSMVSSNADEDGYWVISLIRETSLRKTAIKNCENCHSSVGNRGRRSKFDVKDFVIRNQLLEFTGKVERRRKGIVIPHAIHLDKGYNCLDCHNEIAHGPAERMDKDGVIKPTMTICFQCHNDKRAPRDCTICHQLALRMNLGVEGIGVSDTPNLMYPDNAVCGDCHLAENNYKMNTKAIKKQVCVEECHEEGYDDTVIEWQDQTMELLNKVEPQILAVERDIANAKRAGRNVGPAELLFNDANYNYRLVKDDGSKGAHNSDYAEALLGVAQEKIDMAKDLMAQ